MKHVRDALVTVVDTVGKSKGELIVRRGFFYMMGQNSEKFAARVNAALEKAGLTERVVQHGAKYANFRGGQTVAQGSHFWAVIA